MNGENIIKNSSCDPSVMADYDQARSERCMEQKKIAAYGMSMNVKNPMMESAEKKESAHAVLNDITGLTEQVERLSETIRLAIIGPVPVSSSECCGQTYRLVDRLRDERSQLSDIRAILQDIRDSL